MTNQNCGTCGWWMAWRKGSVIGGCHVPLPDCVSTGAMQTMGEGEGTSCPCHKKKEGE